MATRVDGQGYLLGADGKRGTTGNDPASVQARWNGIVESWKTANPNDADGRPDEGTVIMEVEQGDCQWTIAEDAGSDPLTTYQQLNAQHKNPHLIDKGDIVFVDRPTHFSRNAKGEDNVDLFRDSIAERSNRAVNWESGDAGPAGPEQWQSIQQDIDSYLQSTGYDPTLFGNLIAPGDDHAWGSENGHGRQLLLERYFAGQPDNAARQQLAESVANAPDADADLKRQTEDALRPYGMAMPQPLGTADTAVGPRITAYVPNADGSDNSEVFSQQFRKHAGETDSGLLHSGDRTYRNPPGLASVPLGDGTSFSPFEADWNNLEYVTGQYLGTTPEDRRREIVQSLLADGDLSGRGRQAAAYGYLETYASNRDTLDAKAQELLAANPSLEVQDDIRDALERLRA